jgi:hypothetical protein
MLWLRSHDATPTAVAQSPMVTHTSFFLLSRSPMPSATSTAHQKTTDGWRRDAQYSVATAAQAEVHIVEAHLSWCGDCGAFGGALCGVPHL